MIAPAPPFPLIMVAAGRQWTALFLFSLKRERREGGGRERGKRDKDRKTASANCRPSASSPSNRNILRKFAQFCSPSSPTRGGG